MQGYATYGKPAAVPVGQAGRALWARWTLATALGELLGFALAMGLGGLVYLLVGGPVETVSAVALLGGAVLAGVVEGSVLGTAQWLVLRRYLPALAPGTWIAATAGGAVLAYAVGMSTGTALGDSIDLAGVPGAILIVAGVLYVAGLGALLGVTQWWVLRRYVAGAGWWVAANAGAWILGLAVGLAGPSLVADWAATGVVIAMGAGTGILMGGLVGAVTGAVLVRLLRHRLDPAAR
jgi:hypothetical protein